ncbi:uncharacterized protein LOC131649656 [Vicia villosa]|uniref:uncharacterized protein LOC131649656 n=1 Tax=Vicia villosa TaxID=3911 RepID=UPI00273C1220|nr:uncharacterized protein LOC131649656 [Vicia villosa]
MEKWKEFALSKEEEEGVVADEEEIIEDESIQRTLAGKLWTESNFNTRAFKTTMLNAWKLKHAVEVQDLSKNLFLFKFGSKRDMEYVLKSGPWSFGRALLVLRCISGEEQPSDLNMHFSSFWVRVYDLPLMLRSETMAKKLGNIIGSYEEMDVKEAHRNGRFLRIKVTLNLKEPLKRGTVVSFKEKKIRVHFKYERLPTFCFVCGRMGHQIKDCEAVEDLNEEGYEELEEQDLAFGQWLRASPLPKMNEDFKRKDSSSSLCSRELFNVSSSQSRCEHKGKGDSDDLETQQDNQILNQQKDSGKRGEETNANPVDVETVAESLGAVALSTEKIAESKEVGVQKRKWVRRKTTKSAKTAADSSAKPKLSKRHLVDVMVVEGSLEDYGGGDKKRKQVADTKHSLNKGPEVVLDDQHRLPQ